MKIYIQDEVLEFENDPKTIERIFTTINKHLDKKGLQFSHLIIDGTHIYDDFYNYFIKNSSTIQKVEVVPKSITELVNETMLSADEYIRNALPLINRLAEEFYQQAREQTWSQLENLFEGMQWIMETLTQIDSINNLNTIVNDYETWNEYVQEVSQLSNIIPELHSAMIGKDNILIADMAMYEITPVFERMLEKLQFLLPKVVDKDVS